MTRLNLESFSLYTPTEIEGLSARNSVHCKLKNKRKHSKNFPLNDGTSRRLLCMPQANNHSLEEYQTQYLQDRLFDMTS